MQIFFQTQKIDLHPEDENHMARRLEGLRKFFSAHAHAYVDVKKTRADHNGQDLFYVSINIDDGPHKYFTEEYEADTRKAFDEAYADMYRVIRKDRGRSQTILKSAGRRFKKLFQRRNSNR